MPLIIRFKSYISSHSYSVQMTCLENFSSNPDILRGKRATLTASKITYCTATFQTELISPFSTEEKGHSQTVYVPLN